MNVIGDPVTAVVCGAVGMPPTIRAGVDASRWGILLAATSNHRWVVWLSLWGPVYHVVMAGDRTLSSVEEWGEHQ